MRGCSARSSLGLRAHRQPDKPTQRLGTLSCLRLGLPVLLNQRFAIDPHSPSIQPFDQTVTALEPRTPHQLEKLKKRSKNDCLFTPSVFLVNGKSRLATLCVFNYVHAVHRRMTGFGAGQPLISRWNPRGTRLFARCFNTRSSWILRLAVLHVCEYPANGLPGKEFTGRPRFGAVPTGLISHAARLPGTTVPAFLISPLRGWYCDVR